MSFIKGLLVIIIPILTLDIFYVIQDLYAKRELVVINKRREDEANDREQAFIPFELDDIKSKFTSFMIFICMVLAMIYVALTTDLWRERMFLEILKMQYFYYAIFFLSYLNVKIIITKISRFIKQIKGEF